MTVRVPYPQLPAYLAASLDHLREHLGGLFVSHGMPILRELRSARHGEGLYVEVWLPKVPLTEMPVMMWDAFLIEPDAEHRVEEAWIPHAAALAEAAVSPLPVAGRVTYPDIPLYDYHPQRYRTVVPYAKQVAQIGVGAATTVMTPSNVEKIGGLYQTAYKEALHATPLRGRLHTAHQRQGLAATQLALFVAEFHSHGRQIYDFPTALSDMFAGTDVEDIRFDALHLPYRCFYLRFPPQWELETQPGWSPDGVYVVSMPEQQRVQILLTSRPRDPSRYWQWVDSPEPIYIQVMTHEEMGMCVVEAADRALAQKMEALREQLQNGASVLADGMARTLMEEAAQQGILIEDVTKKGAAAALERLPQLAETYKQMLRLIVNALAYLTAYPEDRVSRLLENAPAALGEQSVTGTPKARQRAQSKLAALGYTAVHYCGQRVDEQLRRVMSGERHQEGRKPSWVRGHWFLQAHGPQWSLRRLRWKMPFLRNADEPREPDGEGHIYLVSDDGSQQRAA